MGLVLVGAGALSLAAVFFLAACASAPEPVAPGGAPVDPRPSVAPPAPEAPTPEPEASGAIAPSPPVESRARWSTPEGEIDVVLIGEPRAGQLALVVLHGHGALPEDMVPLGRELASALPLGALPLRVAVPTSPRTWRFGGAGRAWFEREAADADRQIERARGEIDAVCAHLRDEGARSLVVLGFSQGASLAIEVALDAGERGAPLAGLVALSPRDLTRYRRRFGALRELPVFVSHGRIDSLIPFENGTRIAERAAEAGARTTFVPFDGDHEIPLEVRAALEEFLRQLATH